VVLSIRDENAVVPVHAQMFGAVEAGLQCWAQSSAWLSRPGNRADSAVWQHDPQGMPSTFQNPDTSCAIRNRRPRIDKGLLDCGLSVLGNASVTVSGNRANLAGAQVNFPNAAIAQVGNNQPLAGRIEGNAIHLVELCLTGWATIT
jgi:hypothetical protein